MHKSCIYILHTRATSLHECRKNRQFHLNENKSQLSVVESVEGGGGGGKDAQSAFVCIGGRAGM